MKTIKIVMLLFLSITTSFAQTKEEKIMEEAMLLYNSEKASWHGTDIFMAKYSDLKSVAGGYVSYSKDGKHHCIFYDKQETPNVLVRFSFDDDFDLSKVKIDDDKRKVSEKELNLITIKKIAHNKVRTDSIFKHYENSNLNLVPIISKKEKKVYAITGLNVGGVVVLGNDYLMTFNKKNKLKKIKSLHKNILTFDTSDQEINKGAVTMHSHLKSSGYMISPVDVCTLMLYEPYAGWKQHIVVSEKFVSFFDIKERSLVIITRKAYDRMNEHFEKKEK
ncbi:hypothetical protein [Aureivirga sp. CE67]|uniref:hypothetical protein n=1 Tax=Aureivirga sp. CE67 TaxID=1788983 RepID=UPI0018CABDD0|nr:hypothetical protein [Aureivirga sp. CE67]